MTHNTSKTAAGSTENKGHVFKTLKSVIDFPFEPYGIQKVMMNTIIRSLKNKQHSLIESPTGTGKTLTLLCSTLAWLKKSKELRQPFISDALSSKFAEERKEKLRNEQCTCGKRSHLSDLEEPKENMKKGNDSVANRGEATRSTEENSSSKRIKLENITERASQCFEQQEIIANEIIVIDDDDDDDDDDCQIIETTAASSAAVKQESAIKIPEELNDSRCAFCMAVEAEATSVEDLDENEEYERKIASKAKVKIPKIYYGTRTHKQITQVIRELKKTSYGENLNMSILSSRDRTCVNENVKDKPNRNDLCQDLIKIKIKPKANETCPYYAPERSEGIFDRMSRYYEGKCWDIEDAYKFGRAHKACPYYGIRSLQEDADITFCPYNYLIDPSIRKTMNIKLNNAIVIFDEAHNIEDICRDIASYVSDTREIDELLRTINLYINYSKQRSKISCAYQFISERLILLETTMKNVAFVQDVNNNYCGDKELRNIWTQSELKSQLDNIGFGPEGVSKFNDCLKIIKDGQKKDLHGGFDDKRSSQLSYVQLQSLRQLCLTLKFMYSKNCESTIHFKAVVTKQSEANFLRFNQRSGHNRQQSLASNTFVWQISLLCMNPGIVFEMITKPAWSIIVASGTLTPLESLRTELGCTFENVYEGKHVIENQRVFASVLSRGPNGVELNCAFVNSLRPDFQDEVGYIVRDVCVTVPNGILCFFSSYDRMNIFYQRWFAKGLLTEIEKAGKKIFRERKNCSITEFDSELEEYNKQARMKGALLFAVYRGKVSEGIDFADSAARAVLTIGIPYPNVKEVAVKLKKEYNDSVRSIKPHLMTGNDWYAAQAFRALNQALGRCIRHKDDWGAIIMIDSRLRCGNSLQKIPKWVRSVVQGPQDYRVAKASLEKFVNEKLMEEEKQKDIQK